MDITVEKFANTTSFIDILAGDTFKFIPREPREGPARYYFANTSYRDGGFQVTDLKDMRQANLYPSDIRAGYQVIKVKARIVVSE